MIKFCMLTIVLFFSAAALASAQCDPYSIHCGDPNMICSADGELNICGKICDDICTRTEEEPVKNITETEQPEINIKEPGINETETPEIDEGFGFLGRMYRTVDDAMAGNIITETSLAAGAVILILFIVYWKRFEG